jgi:ribonuclease HI
MSILEKQKVTQAIKPMLLSGALVQVEDEPGQFISKVFTVPKSDGRSRLVINLRSLNEFVSSPHFKMEDHRSACNLLHEGCYMASVDLKDAYYIVPIHKSHQIYLRFRWQGQLYQYTCVPFGLNAAPRLFTKIMKPVFTYLRKKGNASVCFLDDTLLVGRTFNHCEKNVEETVALFRYLGLIVNESKSVFIPVQQIKFLGFILDSSKMIIHLPDEKRRKIKGMVEKLPETDCLTIHYLSQVIGTLVSAIPAIRYAQVYTRSLECDKIAALQLNNGNYLSKATISEESKSDCQWWLANIEASFNLINSDQFDATLYTDASLSGWGGVRCNDHCKGYWSNDDRSCHINELELRAVFNSLRSLVTETSIKILLRVDNTTAVSYINKYGGCRSSNCQTVAKKIWQWCEERKNSVFASYINTLDNLEADKLSRDNHVDLDFMLSHSRFQEICCNFGTANIDLFASSRSCQVPKFISWFPDINCLAVDAFTVKWSDGFYAFPPFNLVGRVIRKIFYDNASGIVVVPQWPSQPWFPYYMQMAGSVILLFAENTDSIICPYLNRSHSLSQQVPLMAAVLSKKSYARTATVHQ